MVEVEAAVRLGTFELRVAFATAHRRIVLFGPSGAGKSLTLQCLAGFLTPARGRIAVNGGVLFDSASGINVPPWKRRVGLVPQAYTLFPHLSVGQNVGYGLGPIWRGREPVRIAVLLAAVGLTGFADRLPASLSGGQRQRVALAQALGSDPRLLLLDEPFSAVDAPVRERLRRDLLTLLDGFAVPLVFVTHDFDEAYLLGQTVVILDHGRVLQMGTPGEVAAAPRSATVARLVGAANILEGEIAGQEGDRLLIRVGPLRVRAVGGVPSAGRRAVVCVHPEDVKLRPPGGGVTGARVLRVLARRSGATVLLDAGGVPLEAGVTGPAPDAGAAVGVEIPDGAAHLVEPDAGIDPDAGTEGAREA